MSTADRSWMYQRLDEHGFLSPVFRNGLKTFIEFACSKPSFMDENKIRCPCLKKCKNRAYQEVETAKFHLAKFGFVPNYFLWDRHGETLQDREKQVNDNLRELEEVDDNHMFYEVVEGHDRKRKAHELDCDGNSIVPNKTRANSSETYTSPQIDGYIDSLETNFQRLKKIADGQHIIIEKLYEQIGKKQELIDKQHAQMKEAMVGIQKLIEMVNVLISKR